MIAWFTQGAWTFDGSPTAVHECRRTDCRMRVAHPFPLVVCYEKDGVAGALAPASGSASGRLDRRVNEKRDLEAFSSNAEPRAAR